MRRALWLVGLLLLAAACTREPGISPGDGNSDPAGASRNPVMSMERLQELALELPDDFSDGLSTRSARRMIREVVPVTDFIDGSLLEPFAASVAASGTKAAATRAGGVAPANASPGSLSAEADVAATLGRIYVVNYEDDAGFAILSADRQLPSVLGYADSGNITDTMTNPGIKLFLERLPDFVATSLLWDSRTDPDPPVDPDPGGGGTDPGPAPDPSDTTVVYRYHHNGIQRGDITGPYVTVRWGQGAPFNDNTPECMPHWNTPAGCVAIAMLQIMSYHQYPTNYKMVGLDIGPMLDWPVLNTYRTANEFLNASSPNQVYRTIIAGFVERIGADVGMVYSCTGSGAPSANANQVLRNYGYQTDGLESYSWNKVTQSLRNAHPVYMEGFNASNSEGHAWVIDGYMAARIPVDVFMDVYDSNGNFLRGYYLGIQYEYEYLPHCNWGWDGDGDGYFHAGVFAPAQPVYQDDGESMAGGGPYTRNLNIIKNIRR